MVYTAAQLQLREYTAPGGTLVSGLTHLTTFQIMPKTWTKFTISITTQATTGALWPFVGSTGQSLADLLYFDNMFVGLPAGANLLTAAQADLESGGTPWTANANCTVAISADQAQSGTHSLKLTPTSAAGAASAFLGASVSAAVACSPSTAYKFDCWCYWNGGNYPPAKGSFFALAGGQP